MQPPATTNSLVPGKLLSSESDQDISIWSRYLLLRSNASNVGIVPGIFLNGWLAAKYGYRKVIIVALFFLNAFIFITFFAPNKPVLVVGQILCGFSWGVFATIGPAYASEIVPLQLRGYLTSYVNLCCKQTAIYAYTATDMYQGPLDNSSPLVSSKVLSPEQTNGHTASHSPCNGPGLYLSWLPVSSLQSRLGTWFATTDSTKPSTSSSVSLPTPAKMKSKEH